MSDSMDYVTAFRDAMAAEGIRFSGQITADGKLHRFQVDDDPKGRRNGWYVLHLDDRPSGAFGSYKLYGDHKFTWTAKGLKRLSSEERAELSRKAAEARARAAAEELATQEAAKADATTIWDGGADATSHPYLDRKQVGAFGGLRVGPWLKKAKDGRSYKAADNALLIPMRDAKKERWGMQAVFPAKVTISGELRDKDFVYGQRKRGLWHAIGKPKMVDGRLLIGLCEGYATGASVHMATGHAVLVCFDAGNLIHVGRELRRLYPEARIVIFADNDQWTVVREVPTNVGIIKATEAAKTIDGEVVAPFFADTGSKPTDWNDLHVQAGLEEVARQIAEALSPPAPAPAPDPEPDPRPVAGLPRHLVEDEPPPVDSYDGPDGEHLPAELEPQRVEEEATGEEKPKKKRERKDKGPRGDPDAIKRNGWFTILGHDRDTIYIFQHEKKMVAAYGEAVWGENTLITLAPPDWWEYHFGVEGKLDKKMAANAIVRYAYEQGYYDPTTTRGRGAWRDEGRTVIHLGNRLIVDGESLDVTDIESNYVYEQGRRLRMPADEPATGAEGKKIIETAKAFHWTRPASAILCAGWVALAPLCGALPWRPHIWLTGGAGSGKSTILNRFIWSLLNGMEIYAQGNSTEAGIRQTLATDALPVLFEESEQNDERERLRMQAVLALIRQSSTESAAKTLKGSQNGEAMGFMIRSMFCLASIQVGLKHQADMERISILALKPKRTADKDQAAKNWAVIKAAVDDLGADKTLPSRLVRRMILLLPVILENIEVFSRAAADKFGSQRDGDQYGTLLAGAWCLVRSDVATPEAARQMMDRYDWTEYTETTEQEESSKALQTLLERQVRTQRGDTSVYELISRCVGREGPGAWDGHKEVADAILRRHGLMVKWSGRTIEDAVLLVANNHSELEALMKDTPYASDVKGQLLRVPGAFRHGPERFNGTLTRSVGLPLNRVLDGEDGTPPPDDYGEDIPEF